MFALALREVGGLGVLFLDDQSSFCEEGCNFASGLCPTIPLLKVCSKLKVSKFIVRDLGLVLLAGSW